MGEGLVGQCAKDGKIKQLFHIPDNYISISSSIGEAKPNAIMIVPIHLDGEVVGVMEAGNADRIYTFAGKIAYGGYKAAWNHHLSN